MIAFIETTSDKSTLKNTYLLPHGDRVRQGNGFSLSILIKNDYAEMPNQFSVEAGTINGTDYEDSNPIFSTQRNRGYVFHRLYPTELTYGLKDNDSCTEFVINVPRDSAIVTNSGSIGLIIKGYNASGGDAVYAQTALLNVEKVFAKPRENSNISLSQADALAALIVNNFHSQEMMFVMQAPGNGAGSEVKLSARAANGFGIVSGKVVISEDIQAEISAETTETITVNLVIALPPFPANASNAADYVYANYIEGNDPNVYAKSHSTYSTEDIAVGEIIGSTEDIATILSISDVGLISEMTLGSTNTDNSSYWTADLLVTYRKARASDWKLVGRVDTTGTIKMTSPSVSFADSLGYGEFRLTYTGPDADNPSAKGYINLWIQKGISDIPSGTVFDLTIPIAVSPDYVAENANEDFVGTNDIISGHDVEYLAKENNLVIARTLIENINGYSMSPNYSLGDAETVSIGGVNYSRVPIKYGNSAVLTEGQLEHYLLCMTGSERIPMYDYDRPLNTYVMIATGDLYKLQADEVDDGYNLYAWKVSVPYASTSDSTFSGSVNIVNESDSTKTNAIYTASDGKFSITNGTSTWQMPSDETGQKIIATRSWVNSEKTDFYEHIVDFQSDTLIFMTTMSTQMGSLLDIYNAYEARALANIRFRPAGGALSSVAKIMYNGSSLSIVYIDENGVNTQALSSSYAYNSVGKI